MITELPTPAEMAAWDRESAAFGIAPQTLMENASREALHVLEELAPPLAGKKALLFMGGGNNGGDAACLARHLSDQGAFPVVVHTHPLGKARGAAGTHIRLAKKSGVPFIPAASWLREGPADIPDIIVDGLLGTGFHGLLRPLEEALVKRVNNLRRQSFILALDIPSGLNGLTGKPSPDAVRAHATVTFEAAKPGIVLPEAAPFTGRLVVRRIGMPHSVKENLPPSFRLITEDILRLLPDPASFPHKGKAGHVLVTGGSPRYAGAARLAATGALRAGAGLVTLAAPDAFLDRIRGGCPDLMSLPLPGGDWTPEQADAIAAHSARCGAVVLGPGLGNSAGAAELVIRLLRLPDRPPFVVDADALAALKAAEAFSLLHENDVLTPHPGEAAALLDLSVAAVQDDRPKALAVLKELAPSVWLLKGAGTLVGQAGSATGVLARAVPNLAVGGAGDVLSGIIAAFLAQGAPAFAAAQAGALLHAAAGELLAKRFPARGNLASDIADALPAARAALSCAADN